MAEIFACWFGLSCAGVSLMGSCYQWWWCSWGEGGEWWWMPWSQGLAIPSCDLHLLTTPTITVYMVRIIVITDKNYRHQSGPWLLNPVACSVPLWVALQTPDHTTALVSCIIIQIIITPLSLPYSSLFLGSQSVKVGRRKCTGNLVCLSWQVKGHLHGSEQLWRHELPHVCGGVTSGGPTQVYRRVPICHTDTKETLYPHECPYLILLQVNIQSTLQFNIIQSLKWGPKCICPPL